MVDGQLNSDQANLERGKRVWLARAGVTTHPWACGAAMIDLRRLSDSWLPARGTGSERLPYLLASKLLFWATVSPVRIVDASLKRNVTTSSGDANELTILRREGSASTRWVGFVRFSVGSL